MTGLSFEQLKGRSFVATELLSERLFESYRATLVPHLAEVEPGEAPLGIHWCLFPTDELMSGLGADGHPASYPHLPAPPLPRRMWAGGKLEFIQPLRVGDMVTRTTVLRDLERKDGKSGELWFATVDHEYATERGLAIRERQDIVYREPASPGAPATARPAQPKEQPQLDVLSRLDTPPTLLFRYSAIIFNAHRIHYDLPYATQVEGYRGLVVHGPLQATLLINAMATVHTVPPRSLSYRGMSPATGGDELSVCANAERNVFVTRSDGGTHMEARLEVVA